jgi:hypothetical protein
MAITLTTATATAMLNSILAIVDRSGAAGVRFYSTTTRLVTCVCNDPFAVVANNTMTMDEAPAVSGTVATAGTAATWRLTTQNGTTVLSGSASNTGAGGDITFTSTVLGKDETVTVTSLVITQPLTPA